MRAALISPGSTRALSRSVREPFSLPLAAKVESANSIRAEVIGSIDLARVSNCLCPRGRALFIFFAAVIAALTSCLSDIILRYVRHPRKASIGTERWTESTGTASSRINSASIGTSLVSKKESSGELFYE